MSEEGAAHGRAFGGIWSLSLAVLALALYAGMYFPVFQQMVGQWSSDPNASHGFLVPLVSAYLVWERREQLKELPIEQSAWGAALLFAGLALLLLGTLGAELFLQNVSTVIVLAALVWVLLGRAYFMALAFPLGFLFFYVPLPALVLNQIAFPLQLFAAKCAVGTLAVVGIPVLRQGNIIELAGTTLEVAEACSGIRSLQALVALSTIFGYIAQKTLTKRALLVLFSIPIAVAVNAGRVSGTGLIAHYLGVEKAEGFYHGFASWLVFVVAIVLLGAMSSLLSRLPLQRASHSAPRHAAPPKQLPPEEPSGGEGRSP